MKKVSSVKRPVLLSFLLFSVPIVSSAWGQSVADSLFSEVDQRLREAKAQELNILTPKKYEKVEKSCSEARKKFAKGDSLKDIEKAIETCRKDLDQAFEAAKLVETVLGPVFTMRQELIDSDVPVTDSGKFKDAEKKLNEAAEKAEKDDVKGARGSGNEAAKGYREAALEGLLKSDLKLAKEELRNNRNKVAPDKYKEAETLLRNAEEKVKKSGKAEFEIARFVSEVRSDIHKAFTTAGIK